MNETKKLEFGTDMVVEIWEGNDLNPPEVRFEIDAHHTFYDRDWGTAERIIGNHDLSMEDAKKLYDFLGQALAVGGTYVPPVGSEVRTRAGAYPSVPYVKQEDGSWSPKYE